MGRRRLLITGGSGFIGSNLMDEVLERGDYELRSLDMAPPSVAAHQSYHRACNLLDRQQVQELFEEFQPSHVAHLGARTDMLGVTVDDYEANHNGTANVARAIKLVGSVERAVFTSSQFVVGPGVMPAHDEDFRPHTIYGESKVLGEKAVREAGLSCVWTIVRPTNIWGRRHPRYPFEFWRVLKQGRYLHPGGEKVTRCYGYVDNVVDQILTILGTGDARWNQRVFYVGDPPTDLFDWTNAFSLELTGRPVRVVPRAALRSIAKVGDLVLLAGGKFPIFSSRFRSMTESYVTPMEPTFAALGPPPVSMREGVQQTVAWLRSQDSFWR